MSESADKDGKTEEPSEKKIRDALEKGQMPLSREVASFAALGAMLIVAVFLARDAALALSAMAASLFDHAGGLRLSTNGDAMALTTLLLGRTTLAILPVVLLFLLAGIGATLVQGLPRLVADRIRPDWSRLSLVKGLGRIVGPRGAGESLKVLLKFGGTGLVVVLLLRGEVDGVVSAIGAPPAVVPEMILRMLTRLLGALIIVALLIAGIDVVLARRNWRRDLRMSRQELKDEMRQAEGDPAVKGRFRSIARDRARRRMIAAVPRATLVIANPTHYAVALRYLKAEGGAPLVVAKGQDLVALKIREIAEAQGIPVIEDKALARALFGIVEVDRQIPAAFYRAVAELIHFLQARSGRSWSGASMAAMAGLAPAPDKTGLASSHGAA